jgi:hypothetical protein
MLTETPSIPACWEHWLLLPEDLRSSIVKSYGRGQIAHYTNNVLQAVMVWRLTGAWRNKRDRTRLPLTASTSAISNVVLLAERRRHLAAPAPKESVVRYELDQPILKRR